MYQCTLCVSIIRKNIFHEQNVRLYYTCIYYRISTKKTRHLSTMNTHNRCYFLYTNLPIFNKSYYVQLLMEDEPLNKSLHKPRLAILMKIGFVPETLESSEQLPKASTRFVIEDSQQQRRQGRIYWELANAELHSSNVCVYVHSVQVWDSEPVNKCSILKSR